MLLVLIGANVFVSRLRIHGEALPDYASWTGIVTLEQKLRMLQDFARQGEVDALILSSSIGDYGLSAEVLSRELSAPGKPFRVFNFSTGGASAPTYPMLYRLARLVARPKQIWIVYPVEPNMGDEVRKGSPDYSMLQAPLGSALRWPLSLPLSFEFFDLPLVRHAGALRDAVVSGSFVHRPVSHADFVEFSSHGDSLGYGYYNADPATIRRDVQLRREGVLSLASAWAAAGLDEHARSAVYFSGRWLDAIAEMRSLAARDKCPIRLIAHDTSSGLAQQDEAYLDASQPFYKLLSQYYGAPVLDVRASFVPEHYKFRDSTHVNAIAAAELSVLLAARIANRPSPERKDYAASRELREGTLNPKSVYGAAVVLRRRTDPANSLELRYLQNWGTPPLLPSSLVRLAVRLPDNRDVVIAARVIGRGAVLADTSALSLTAEDQVFLAELVEPYGKMGSPMNVALASYTWSSVARPVTFYRQTVANVSAEATSFQQLDRIHASWDHIPEPAKQDWIGVFPVDGKDETRVCFEFIGGGTAGSLQLPPINAPPGQYELRLFRNNSWILMAISQPFAVAGLAGKVEITTSRVSAGQAVHVVWSKLNRPKKDDWVGVFSQGGPNASRLTFQFLGGKPEGMIDLPMPFAAPAGKYEVRLYSAGGWTRLDTSSPFAVVAPNVRLNAEETSIKAGSDLHVRWSGVNSPAKDDWIGIFPKGGAETTRLQFEQTGGSPAGKLSLSIPGETAGGEYELRFFMHGTWQVARVSEPFRIEATSARIEVRPAQLKQGETLSIIWTGIDHPAKDDWVGVFQNGDLTKRVWFTMLGGKPSGRVEWKESSTAAPGAYEAALFNRGGWQKLAHVAVTLLPRSTASGAATGGQPGTRH
jgi:hypothetical protein